MTAVLQQLYDLSYAIFNLDYGKVEQYLADESVEINFFHPRFKKLPREQALDTLDKRMVDLFLNCPRVDWLKPNELDFDDLDRFGVEYDEILKKERKGKVEGFKCLDLWFEKQFPDEAKLIYDKMFEALQGEPEEKLESLVFRCMESPYAFERSLQFCKDINKRFESGNTVLHFVCLSEFKLVQQARLLIARGADLHIKNEHQRTPFCYSILKQNFEVSRLLLDRGYDLHHDGPNDFAFLNFCPDFKFYLDNFELSEADFRCYLKAKSDEKVLISIFEKYPQYRDVFTENWSRI